MKLNSKKELRHQKIERALRNNLRKRWGKDAWYYKDDNIGRFNESQSEIKWMKLSSKKELRHQKIERALRINLKKRKVFQNQIKKESKKK